MSSDTLLAENIFFSVAAKEILKGVTIRADKGIITGLLGRNGSGKSTMLQAMYGTLKVQECSVFTNGTLINASYAKAGLVNYLPQNSFLPVDLTLNFIVRQFAIDLAIVFAYFPDLKDDLNKKIGALSGGKERLWSVLLLLLAKTRFTLLDEPFTHIMPLHIDQLKLLLTEMKHKKGIIITDHNYRHLLDVSDRVYLMKDGKSIYIRDYSDLVLHGYLRHLDE